MVDAHLPLEPRGQEVLAAGIGRSCSWYSAALNRLHGRRHPMKPTRQLCGAAQRDIQSMTYLHSLETTHNPSLPTAFVMNMGASQRSFVPGWQRRSIHVRG